MWLCARVCPYACGTMRTLIGWGVRIVAMFQKTHCQPTATQPGCPGTSEVDALLCVGESGVILHTFEFIGLSLASECT
jgi:hypothetical protein